MMKTVLTTLFLLNYLNYHGSTNVDCNYGINSFWSVLNKYECKVQNDPNIDSPEKVKIDEVTGNHSAGKTNGDEIYFHAESKVIQYFPQGLNSIFPNLVGVRLYNTSLKGIQKSDLKSYKYLKYLCLNTHDIQVLENDLFDFNPNIEYVLFENCKIVHIGLNVFDNLNKLKALYIGRNPCTGDYFNNNENDVKEIIKKSKIECKDPDFVVLDTVYTEIFNFTKYLNHRNFASFRRSFLTLQLVFNNSEYSNYWPLKEKIQNLGKISIWDYLPDTWFATSPTVKTKIAQLTTPKTIQNSTTSCKKCCQFDDFKSKNQKLYKNLNNSLESFKMSVTESLKKIDEKIDNVLSIVDVKITNLEQLLSTKIEQILKDKFDEVLKSLIH